MLQKIKSWFNRSKKLSVIPYPHFDIHQKTILVIDDNIPEYDKSSGSKRLFELLKIFKAIHLNVFFLADDGQAKAPYAEELDNLGVNLLNSFSTQKQAVKHLKGLLHAVDYAWISRPMLNVKYQKICQVNPKTKIIFDTVDLHYVRMIRQAENEKNEKLLRKAKKFKRLELALAHKANATLTVTDTEKVLLEQEGLANVFVVPNVHEIQSYNNKPFAERHGIVFIGGYKHQPNIDAVKWLIDEIMPNVWRSLGDVPVYLLGSYPPTEVCALASDKVQVPGFLENVDSYFLNARIFVAPLRYGAGMKGKIGQSLEFGLPIVSTSIGVEGMNLTHEEQALVADDTIEFTAKIIQLYQDEQLWHKIQKNAVKSIEQYTPTVVKAQIKDLLDTLDQQ